MSVLDTQTLRRPEGYPSELVTIGDHLLATRLERGMEQKEVAKLLGTCAQSLLKWEKNKSTTLPRFYPNIADFLGYCPIETISSFGEKLLVFRTCKGLTQEEMAGKLGIDPSTFRAYENERNVPRGNMRERIDRAMSALSNTPALSHDSRYFRSGGW